MSAHGLLNLLYELRKKITCDNTEARMLYSIYHRTFKLLKITFFGVKTSLVCHLLHSVIMDIKALHYKIKSVEH